MLLSAKLRAALFEKRCQSFGAILGHEAFDLAPDLFIERAFERGAIGIRRAGPSRSARPSAAPLRVAPQPRAFRLDQSLNRHDAIVNPQPKRFVRRNHFALIE